MRRNRAARFAAPAIAAAVSLGVLSCSSSATSQSSAPNSTFTVLAEIAQTGTLSANAGAQLAGLKAGAAYLNAHGGIQGHPVKVTVLNDNGDATTAASALLNYLASNSAPNDIFDGTEGTETAAILPILVQRHLLSEGIGDAANLLQDGAKYPEQYIPQSDVSTSTDSVADYLKSKGYKSVGILQESTGFTENETPTFVAGLKNVGISTHVVAFSATALDVTPELLKLQQSHVNAILLEAIGPSIAYVLSGRQKLAWNIPIVGDPAVSTANLPSLAPGADLSGVYTVVYKDQQYVATADRPSGLNELITQLHSDGVNINQPILLYSLAWDGLMTINHAAEQAKSITSSDLVAALNNLHTTTDPNYATFGTESYTESDHENTSLSDADYPVIPEGSIVDGMIQASS